MPYDPSDPEVKTAFDKAVADAKKEKDTEYQGVKSKYQELITSSTDLKKKFEGIDLEEYSRLKKVDKERLEKEGDFQKLYENSETRHQQALEAKDTRSSKLEKALRKSLVTEAAVKAISEAGGNPNVLMPHVSRRLDMEEREDGGYSIKVLDETLKTPMYVEGNAASVVDLVNKFKDNDDFAPLFKPNGTSGTGTQGTQRTHTSGHLPFDVGEKGEYNITEVSKWWRSQSNKAAAKQSLLAAGVKIKGITD